MNYTETQVQEIIYKETIKKKFEEYFNLEEGWFIDETYKNGEVEIFFDQKHYFEIKLDKDWEIYDIDILNKFKYYYTPDVEGANKYLEDCLHQEKGFTVQVTPSIFIPDVDVILNQINPHIKFYSDDK